MVKYTRPEVEVVAIDTEDVILASVVVDPTNPETPEQPAPRG